MPPKKKPAPGRPRQVRSLRDRWRKADDASRLDPASEPHGEHERRRTESLDSLDRIRGDAPDDDLETRRAADAMEREVERSRRRDEHKPPS